MKGNSIGSTKHITSSTDSRRGKEGLSKRSPISINVTPIIDKGSTSRSTVRTRSAAVHVINTAANKKKKSPTRGSANVHGMPDPSVLMEDGFDVLVDDPREEMIPMDDDALDNIPISMWAANHADSVKKIARQEVMIAQLDGDIERAKEEVVAWRDKTFELQMTNEKLMVEMKAAKDAQKERDANRRDNELLEKRSRRVEGKAGRGR